MHVQRNHEPYVMMVYGGSIALFVAEDRMVNAHTELGF